MAFGSSVLTHKKEQQIKIAGEFKPTVDCLCAIRRGFVAVYISVFPRIMMNRLLRMNFRKTLEALEWPSHYRFLYNRKMKQIAVQACGAEESGAHRVGKPDESNSGEIKCMALVRMIYGDSGWDKKMSYRLIGRAFPQQRLISFKITDAMQIENGRVLTEM